jgi:uncharacterized protein Yka (UPF0111/DUF47 family)
VRLLPKDETFWQFFSRQTSALCAASDILAGATEEGSSSLPGAAVRIKTIERESMQNLQELQLRLHKTFVTPIDPEDISLLSEHLDHLIAAVESISCRLAAYRFDPLPPLMIDLAKGIHTCAESIERAFGMLSVNEPIDDLCRKLLSMEEQTDFAVREGITRLFEQQKDPIALMKEKDIYDIFERLSDSMKDLANALQNVSIKNS